MRIHIHIGIGIDATMVLGVSSPGPLSRDMVGTAGVHASWPEFGGLDQRFFFFSSFGLILILLVHK